MKKVTTIITIEEYEVPNEETSKSEINDYEKAVKRFVFDNIDPDFQTFEVEVIVEEML